MSEGLIDENPHWHRVWELSEFFRGIQILVPGARVGMAAPFVSSPESHICGTPACHAGWAAAFGLEGARFYSDGKELIARHLGFTEASRLRFWAAMNTRLWGNTRGSCMFSSASAFDITGRNPTLEEIADHWLGVAKRLYEIQEGVSYEVE